MKQKKYNEYKKLIENKGWKIISQKFINARTPIEFYCDKEHKTKKLPSDIKVGTGCGECYKEFIYNNEKNKLKNLYSKKSECEYQ